MHRVYGLWRDILKRFACTWYAMHDSRSRFAGAEWRRCTAVWVTVWRLVCRSGRRESASSSLGRTAAVFCSGSLHRSTPPPLRTCRAHTLRRLFTHYRHFHVDIMRRVQELALSLGLISRTTLTYKSCSHMYLDLFSFRLSQTQRLKPCPHCHRKRRQ